MNQEIVFSAKDLASGATLQVAASQQQLKTALDQASSSAGGMGRGANAVDKELDKLTSGTEFAAQGIQMMRGALNSIVWGTIIGAVSAATLKLIDYAVASDRASIDTEKLNSGVLSQAEKFGLLSKAQGELSKTTVDLFNAELELAQFRAVRDSATRAEKIRKIEDETEALRLKFREEAISLEQTQTGGVLNEMITRSLATKAEKIRENEVAVAKLRKEDAEATDILKLYKTSAEEITDKQKKRKDAEDLLTQSIKTQQGYLEEIGKTAEAMRTADIIAEADRDQRIEKVFEEAEAFKHLKEEKIALANLVNIPTGSGSVDQRQKELDDLDNIEQIEARKTQAREASFKTAANLAEAFYAFSNGKSRSLFKLYQAAAITEASIAAYGAANKALNHPPGPPETFPMAAAALSYGLLNVARIASMQFGGGGGGGGSGGGGTPISNTPSRDLRSPESVPRPLNVTVTALDPASVNWDRLVREQIAPAFGEHIEGGGTVGNINIVYERR